MAIVRVVEVEGDPAALEEQYHRIRERSLEVGFSHSGYDVINLIQG